LLSQLLPNLKNNFSFYLEASLAQFLLWQQFISLTHWCRLIFALWGW
jgi:hypothetical protein